MPWYSLTFVVNDMFLRTCLGYDPNGLYDILPDQSEPTQLYAKLESFSAGHLCHSRRSVHLQQDFFYCSLPLWAPSLELIFRRILTEQTKINKNYCHWINRVG